MVSVNKLSGSVDASKSQKVHDLHKKYQLRPALPSSRAKEPPPNARTTTKPSAATKALKARVSDSARTHTIHDTVPEELEDPEETESESSYDAVMHTAHFPPLKQDTANNVEPKAKRQQRVAFGSHIPVSCPPPSNVDTPDQLLQRITAFNPLWAPFYTAQIQARSLKPQDVYHVLVLVSTVACPQVLADILDLLQSLDVPSNSANYAMAAVTLYNHGHASIVQGQLRKRYAAAYLYARFEFFCTSVREEIQQKRTVRRRLARNPSPTTSSSSKAKASSYALDRLTAEVFDISVEKLHDLRDVRQHRERIRKIKDEGKVAQGFDSKCGQSLWNLLPTQEIRSPLDSGFSVRPAMYVTLLLLIVFYLLTVYSQVS